MIHLKRLAEGFVLSAVLIATCLLLFFLLFISCQIISTLGWAFLIIPTIIYIIGYIAEKGEF